jgi:lysophospholipase L1-like esterase
MLMRRAIRNTLTVLISGAVSVVLAELFVRAFVTVRDVGPVFSVHDPVLGKRIKPSFAGERTTPEFKMRLTTNSLGFRGPEPRGFPERPILFLGDSFTLGYGVSDGEEYPALIAAELRRRYGAAAAPVVNAGIGNSGNGFWVKLLRGEAARMKPRLVVMQVTENDFSDNVKERLFALDAHGTLRELPVPAPDPTRRLEALIQAVPGLSYSHLVGLLRGVRAPALGAYASASEAAGGRQPLEAAEQLTLRIIDGALASCQQRGWNVAGLLVGLPPAQEAAVRELFARRNLVVVRVPPKAERPDLYYTIDGHWRAAGHEFVARLLLDALDVPKLHDRAAYGAL